MPNFTAPKTWTTDEDILAADLNTDIRDNVTHLDDWLGELGDPVTAEADSAGFTAETTLLTLNVTIPAGGRDVKLSGLCQLQSSVAADVVTLRLKEGTAVLRERPVVLRTAAQTEEFEIWVRLAAPSPGAHTYTLTAVRASGTGTITMKAAAASPAIVIAESL